MAAYDTLYGTDYAKVMPREPGRALQIVENYLRMRLADGQSLALVIDFAEALAPGADIGALSSEDRFSLATLVKWASDPQFLAGDLSVVLLVENLAEISPRLARNPYVASIELPLPTEEERLDFVQTKLAGRKLASVSGCPARGAGQDHGWAVTHQPRPRPDGSHRAGNTHHLRSCSRRRRRRLFRRSATGSWNSSSRPMRWTRWRDTPGPSRCSARRRAP